MTSQRSERKTRRAEPFTLLAGLVLSFYLLLTALVTVCLTHPPEGHSHSEADGHFHSICLWVQKGIASHTPPAKVILPAVEAALFLLMACPLLVPHIRAADLTGRSPPTPSAIA